MIGLPVLEAEVFHIQEGETYLAYIACDLTFLFSFHSVVSLTTGP